MSVWERFSFIVPASASETSIKVCSFFATTGMPITREDRNESEDVTLAAKDALLNMIDHLVAERGYSREQAYALTSVAVNLHISELVDVPNVTVSAFLPLDIFV